MFLLKQIKDEEFLALIVSKIYGIRYVHFCKQRSYKKKRQGTPLNCMLLYTGNKLLDWYIVAYYDHNSDS